MCGRRINHLEGYIKLKKSIDRRLGICYHVNILFALHPTPIRAGATTVQTEQAADSEIEFGEPGCAMRQQMNFDASVGQ